MRFTMNIEISDDALADAYGQTVDLVDVERSLTARLEEAYFGPYDVPVPVVISRMTRAEG